MWTWPSNFQEKRKKGVAKRQQQRSAWLPCFFWFGKLKNTFVVVVAAAATDHSDDDAYLLLLIRNEDLLKFSS